MNLSEWDTDAALVERARLGRSLLRQLVDHESGAAKIQSEYVEDELQSLIAAVEKGRNVSLLVSLYGFDGTEPKTLETVGQAYGLTRERVRQLGDRAQRRLALQWHDTPRLSTALECVRQVEPAGHTAISHEFRRRGISRTDFSIDAILEAVELIGHDAKIQRFSIGNDVLYGLGSSRSLVRLCVQNLRRSTSSGGCTSVERLALEAELPIDEASKVRRILDALSETIWLDDTKTWVMSNRPTRNRLANYAGKVFAAASRVGLSELRRCLSRPHRVQFVPPAEVLSKLLEIKGVARREGDLMVYNGRRPEVLLSGIESILLEGFLSLGSPLPREALEEYCIDQKGMNPTSFYIYLSYSPIVTKLLPGVYSLVGTDVAAGSAEQIRASQIQSRPSPEHGWTTSGALWLLVPLDRVVITATTRSIPTYVSGLTTGHWTCRVPGGLDAGHLKIENGFVSGLRDAFTLLAPEPGDFLRLAFDLQSRVVEAMVGGLELKDWTQPDAQGDGFEEDESDTETDDSDLDGLDGNENS